MTAPTGVWELRFASDDGTVRGLVRLEVAERGGSRQARWRSEVEVPGVAGGVLVADDDVPAPRGDALEVRAEGLWAELVCETPGEHWSVGLEAFGVVVDDLAAAGPDTRGERVPVGLDLGWEVGDPAAPPPAPGVPVAGRVAGEVLVGTAAFTLDGAGTFSDTRG